MTSAHELSEITPEVSSLAQRFEPQLIEIGNRLRAEATRLLAGEVTKSDAFVGKTAAGVETPFIGESNFKIAELGALEHVIPKIHSEGGVDGVEAAIFSNKKAVVKFADGSHRLLDVHDEQVERNFEWLLYDSKLSGGEYLRSMYELFKRPDEKTGSFMLPLVAATHALKRAGATDEFLDQHITGGKVAGYGLSRLAIHAPNNHVQLIGNVGHRAPVPDIIFPMTVHVNDDLQIETLANASTKGISQEDLRSVSDSMNRAGWNFFDQHVGNVGRLQDGSLRMLDQDATGRMKDEPIDAHIAAATYRAAIADGVSRYGRESQAVGGFYGEYGRWQLALGERQSAEEYLGLGLQSALKHEDWELVKDNAEDLIVLNKKLRNKSKVQEYTSVLNGARRQLSIHRDNWDW